MLWLANQRMENMLHAESQKFIIVKATVLAEQEKVQEKVRVKEWKCWVKEATSHPALFPSPSFLLCSG